MIAAAPEMLGMLRRHLPTVVSRVVTGTVDQNYTNVPQHEVPAYLAGAVAT